MGFDAHLHSTDLSRSPGSAHTKEQVDWDGILQIHCA